MIKCCNKLNWKIYCLNNSMPTLIILFSTKWIKSISFLNNIDVDFHWINCFCMHGKTFFTFFFEIQQNLRNYDENLHSIMVTLIEYNIQNTKLFCKCYSCFFFVFRNFNIVEYKMSNFKCYYFCYLCVWPILSYFVWCCENESFRRKFEWHLECGGKKEMNLSQVANDVQIFQKKNLHL